MDRSSPGSADKAARPDRCGRTDDDCGMGGSPYSLTVRLPVRRRKGTESRADTDLVARETFLLLRVDGRDLCRLQCSPDRTEDLAVGFLCAAGLLSPCGKPPDVSSGLGEGYAVVDIASGLPAEDILRFRRGLTLGTGCGAAIAFDPRGAEPPRVAGANDAPVRFRADALREAMAGFQRRSAIYRETGGVHAAAIADGEGIVSFAEDVGRHNAADKAIGFCVRRGVPLQDKALLSTGRISLDLASKAVRTGIPVVASRSAPTDAAVELARARGITLIGFLRGDRMNIYSSEWRIE